MRSIRKYTSVYLIAGAIAYCSSGCAMYEDLQRAPHDLMQNVIGLDRPYFYKLPERKHD